MSLSEDRKLSANSLRRPANLKALGFRTTKGLDQLSGLIGRSAPCVRSISDYPYRAKDTTSSWWESPAAGAPPTRMNELKRAAASMPAPDDWGLRI